MAISFGSINTGLPKDIVQQILSAERIPITKMENRKARLDEKSKLVNELSKLFEELKTDLLKNNSAKTLRELKAVFNNEIVDVVVDQEKSEPGEYRIEVSQLAQKSSIVTTGFEDPDNSYVGVGYVQYSLPNGDTREIYVDSDHASLKGVATLINSDQQSGMRATVINDGRGGDTPWRLLISLQKTGDDNNANFPYFYFVDGDDDLEIDEEREAHDAIIKLDGFEMELGDNSSSDLIPGLSIDFKKAKPGEEFSIKVTENREAIVGKVTSIVEKLNKILQFIITQNQIDGKTDTSRTLGGDISLQTIETKIRNTLFESLKVYDESPNGEKEFSYKRVGDLGISFLRSGLIQFDDKKFTAFLSKNFQQVFQMLVGFFENTEDGNVKVKGFLNKVEDISNLITKKPEGVLTLRKQGIQSTVDQINKQIENRERMIEKRESMLKDRFARLEETISKLKTQGAGVAAMGGGTGDIVPKLG